MTLEETMAALEAAGSEKTRAIYRRHGMRGPLFGVSFAALGALKKKIKTDQALAEALWATGNQDARQLAVLIADPQAVADETLAGWAAAAQDCCLADAVASLIGRTGRAGAWVARGIAHEDEWPGRIGWRLVCYLAMEKNALPDRFFLPYLETIRSSVGTRPNRVREAMNSALICIGGRSPALETASRAVARAVGTIPVDQGETGCKTPDPQRYLDRVIARKGYVVPGG